MKASNLISLGVLPILVVGSVLCAPQNTQQTKQQATIATSTVASQQQQQQQSTSTQATTSSAPSSTTSSSSSGSAGSGISRAANNEHSEQSAQPEAANNQAFDGRNLFADDSLWQIPIHLVRDLSTAADGNRNDGQSVAAKVSAPDAASAEAAATAAAADNAGADEADQADEPSSYADKLSLINPSASQPASRVSSSDDEQSLGSSADLKTAAGYHYPSSSHGGHHAPAQYGGSGGADYGKGYFQYANVPKPYTWESGYRRGNPYHTIERHEQAKGPHYQGKVKWSDKHAGHGVHIYDYNHDDHHGHHKDHHDDHYDEKHAPKYEEAHHNEGGHHGGHKRNAGYHH